MNHIGLFSGLAAVDTVFLGWIARTLWRSSENFLQFATDDAWQSGYAKAIADVRDKGIDACSTTSPDASSGEA